jgi:hypothetical protein
VQYINLFISKFIKRKFFNVNNINNKNYLYENKINNKLNYINKNKFIIIYLKIFFFEKSKIFKNSISKKLSNKFPIKVYKDFYYKNLYKLRKFYYITKSFYIFLSKKYGNLKYSIKLLNFIYNKNKSKKIILNNNLFKKLKNYNKYYFFNLIKSKINKLFLQNNNLFHDY